MDREMTDLFRKAKSMKNMAVRRLEGDVPHLVDIYRNDARVARLACVFTEDVLTIMHNAPGACCADRLVLAVDAWGSTDQVNPITGAQWEFGDMDKIAERDLGVHRGMLFEALQLLSYRRDGANDFVQVKYRRGKRRVEWNEPEPYESAGGRYPRVAREGFERPTIAEQMVAKIGPPPDGFDVEPLIRKASVSWVGMLGDNIRVMEGPKGPGLTGVGYSPDMN